MARGDRERARIVDFWRAVELFEPQKVDRPNLGADAPVSKVEPGLPLPWEEGHPVTGRPLGRNRVRRHTVYLGVFSTDQIRTVLDRAFGSDPEQAEIQPSGETALAAFEVDEQGRALLCSQTLSACGWAVGRTISPGPRSKAWLEGFDRVEERFGELYEWLVAEPGPGPTRALLSLLDGGLGGLLSGPLEELLQALNAALSVSAEAAGSVTVAGAELDLSASLEAGAEAGTEGTGEEEEDEAPSPEGPSRILRHRELDALLRTVASLTGVTGHLELEIRVKTRTVSMKEDAAEKERQDFLLAQHRGDTGLSGDPFPDTTDTSLLNSFIAADLAGVSRSVAKGDYGPALRAYLSSSAEVERLRRQDVRAEGPAAVARVAPEHTPAGRWPAKDTHPLVLSQQIAVNAITELLGERPGLFAVNGPPGTGKTTLLRDLVAHVVVERARVLAGFDKPWAAFTDWTGWDASWGRLSFPRLRSELAGFEIVVASANNGAVDNVTTEIPGREAVDERWRDADYFAATATNMLDGDRQAWGALAAQLGNAGNRRRFVGRFWWGNLPDGSSGRDGMQDLLKELENEERADPAAAQKQWRAAIEAFEEALDEQRRLVAERTSVRRRLDHLPRARTALQRAEALHETRRKQESRSRARREAAEKEHLKAAEALSAAEAERSRHWEFKPGFWDVLFSLGRRLREWQRADDEILTRLHAARQEERDRAQRRGEAEQEHGAGLRALADAQRGRDTAARELAAAESAVEQAERRWPGHVPRGERLTDERLRELSAPWSDPELSRARTEVFLAALGVHEAFVRAVPGRMRKSLRAAMSVLSGEARNAPDGAVRDALRALFLVVPVVSSTFASFPRLFKAFDAQSLGWLLVDEAGQATPQQAVGALWRSRRAVVVGDPLQLQPVTTLSLPAQQHLRGRFKVEDRWLPARASVQSLADSVTPLGTLLERGEGEPLWVGAPLRVHRRCDDPMFTVSNTVAYDGMMVYGTPEREEFPLPPSQWVHVPREDTGSPGHWREAEGRKLKWLLEGLQRYGHPMEDVFVLAPFRDVAQKAAKIARSHGVKRSGTIHTSQGKEASVVVFVLGGSPFREGALEWASKTPNLLNVAASRAKRRLYVIGDHTAWAGRHHFATLGRHLPRRSRADG